MFTGTKKVQNSSSLFQPQLISHCRCCGKILTFYHAQLHACIRGCSFLRLEGNLVYILFIDNVLKITVTVTVMVRLVLELGVRVRLRVALLLEFIMDNNENQHHVLCEFSQKSTTCKYNDHGAYARG